MRKNTSKASPGHSHPYSIADHDAVQELLKKIKDGDECESIDEGRFCEAIETAASQYENATEEVRQAFFHGLLTGYSVVIQTQKASLAGLPARKPNDARAPNGSRTKAAGR